MEGCGVASSLPPASSSSSSSPARRARTTSRSIASVEPCSVRRAASTPPQTMPAPKPRGGIVSPMFGVGPEHLHVGVGPRATAVQARLDGKRDVAHRVPAGDRLPPPLLRDICRQAHGHLDERRSAAVGDSRWSLRGGRPRGERVRRRNRLRDVPQSPVAAARVPRTRRVDWSSPLRLGRSHALRWKRNLGASETSPTVVGSRLYIGTAEGNVYCLRASDGKTLWSYHVGEPVKGAIAYDRGRVFFGSYDGHALRPHRRHGEVASGRRRPRSGHFYSTPAVAYSRVYVGSTDHAVYAFDERTGARVWSSRDRLVRLRLPCRLGRPCPRRLVRPRLLRPRRGDGEPGVDIHGRRADLGFRNSRRPTRLLLPHHLGRRSRRAAHVRARRSDRSGDLVVA